MCKTVGEALNNDSNADNDSAVLDAGSSNGNSGNGDGDNLSHHAKSNSEKDQELLTTGDVHSSATNSNTSEQQTIAVTQSATVVPRPRPIRPQANENVVVNIDTRDDVLEVSHNQDGTVTITLANNKEVDDNSSYGDSVNSANTIYVANGDRQQAGFATANNNIIAMSESFTASEAHNSAPTLPSSHSDPNDSVTQLPSYTPTASPTRLFDPNTGLFYGPPIYYPNFAMRRCDSDPSFKPKWTSDDELF